MDTEEWEEKLNRIFQDEAAMGQILSLAHALSGKEEGDPQKSASEMEEDSNGGRSAPGSAHEAEPGVSSGGDDNPLSLLDGLDPRILSVGMKVLQEYNRGDDRKAALLMALKPFVRKKRYAKLDRAVRIARLSRVIRVALEAFRESGEQDGGEEG